jgi:hypothetical protein
MYWGDLSSGWAAEITEFKSKDNAYPKDGAFFRTAFSTEALFKDNVFEGYARSWNNARHISLREFNAGVYRVRLLWHHV